MYSYISDCADYGRIKEGDSYPVELPMCPNCKEMYFYKCNFCGLIDPDTWYLSYYYINHHFFHVKTFVGSDIENIRPLARQYLVDKLGHGNMPRRWSLLPGFAIMSSP